VLHGLLRVRGFTQDDAHIFCRPSQIESEVEACVDFAFAVMKNFGFDKFEVELRLGSRASGELRRQARRLASRHRRSRDTMKRMNIRTKRWKAKPLLCPKIDVKLIDAIGRSWQLTTVQFDFNLPARFGLQYVAMTGQSISR